MLLAFIFVPLLGAAIMPIIRKIWAKGSTWIMTLVSFYLVVTTGWIAYQNFLSSQKLVLTEWLLGQKLALSVDGLSLIALAAIGLVSLVTAIYSAGYSLDPDRRPGYNALLLLIVAGMNGLVMSTDLFSLYVFLEIVSLVAYILIAYQNDVEGLEGSFKYFMLSSVATVFLLLGTTLLFAITGSVSFIDLAAGIKSGNIIVQLGFVSVIFAFLVKAGMIPFHAWLPDAYTAAPSPVSILLAGIVTKICGVYTLMRVVLAVFGFTKSFSLMLLLIGAISVVLGAFLAFGQKNFKRMLAFSSISQIGYMMMGFATGSPLGLIGAAFHFFNHAVFKSLLFINAGAVEQATGTRNFDELGGLAGKMPVTGVTSIIGMLSTAGIPPLAGFWSKLIIIIALWQGGYHSYALIAVFASVITLGYLLSLQHSVFFGKVKQGLEEVHEVKPVFYWPAIIMASITVCCGIFFWFIIPKLILPVSSLLGSMLK
ncbi:MAG TPA: NADH-quinone oxidoreductase subunit L [Firmicutes bacterium]|nr:NADH-quinone oxidoreductase subunit L [Bacillota bacterium]